MRSSIASNTLSRVARRLCAVAVLAVAMLGVSAPAGAAFVNNGDGTISDSVTGLVWDQAPFVGCGGGGTALRTWQNALKAAATASGCGYRGYNDWRLPNIKELESLVDVTQSATSPAVFANGLIAAPSSTTYFWSSTTYPSSQAGVVSAFTIFTYDGNFTSLQISNNAYALLVRGGQSFDTLHPPPVVSATSVAPIGYVDATFNATSNADGTGFFIVVAATSAVPTAAQVVSLATTGGTGSYANGATVVNVIASGSAPMGGGTAAAFPLTGLAPATAYAVYFVANDNFGNASPLDGPVGFTTLNNTTTTTIAAIDPNPLTFIAGATATVGVNVVRNSDGTALVAGSVTVQNTTDGTSCTIDLASATSCAIAIAGAGDKSLSAAFTSADTIHFANSATAAPSILTVSRAAQTIVFGAPPSIAVGSAGNVIATGGASGNPVVFATTSTSCMVTASGAVTGLTTGPCVVTATQAGNTDYLPAASATQTLTITQASSGLVLTSNSPSPTFGQTVIFTATLTSANMSAGGTVAFSSTTFILTGCAAQPLVGNTATCAAANIPAGLQTITAVYSGDANTLGSSSQAFTQLVVKAHTTTTLTTPPTITFGQTVDVAAAVVVAAPGAGVPTGNITISDGSAAPGDSCTIALPADHCTLTPSTPGNKTLTATYVPDSRASPNMQGSSATAVLSIDPATSSVIVGASANPSVFGQSVTLTAFVTTSNPNAGGLVNFSEGGVMLVDCAPAPMTIGGVVTCQTSSLAVGQHAIVATYSGDANTPGSSNAASPLQQAVFKASTAVTLTPPAASVFGSAVSIGATVAVVAPGAGTLTGAITISDGDGGAGDTCTIHLPATSCSLTPGSVGTKTLTATYTPDAIADVSFYTSKATGSLTVGTAATNVDLSSSSEPAVFGQSITFTAKIVSSGLNPSGNVVFMETNGLPIDGCSVIVIDKGFATCQTNTLAVGAHSIVAVYQGDANNVGSSNADAPLQQTVNKATTLVTLTPPGSIALGGSVSIAATVAVVTPGAGSLSGTIVVSDGGAGTGDTCTIVLPATNCSLTPSSAGAKTLAATYTPDLAADPNFTGSSANGSLVVTAAASGAVLASSANPSVFGQGVTFTATITPVSGGVPPTGTVTFNDGAVALCSGVALTAGTSNASAVCATSSLAVGTHAISAMYSGDGNNQTSTATLTNGQVVHAAATTTTITLPVGIVLGASVNVHVAVAAQAPGVGTPAGTVTVSDGGASCVAILTNGSGNCTLTPPAPVGMHTLSAVYTATTDFATSTGSATLNVDAASAGTVLSASANPSVFGQSVVLTAIVTPAAGNPVPTGNVTFRDGETLLCNAVALAAVGGGANATCTAAALAVGSHALSASYAGDANNLASTGMFTQIVNPAATTLSIDAPASLALGQPATVTAHLTVTAPGAGTPNGNIVIGDGSASCTIVLPAASCSLQPTSAGVKTLTATYAGDGNFGASRVTAPLTVTTVTSNVTLTSTPNPSIAGQTVTFMAVVSAAAADGGTAPIVVASAVTKGAGDVAMQAMPTGTVEFRDGATLLATVALDASGHATYATNALVTGAHTISASYSGDASTAAATVTNVQQVDAVVTPTAAVPAPALSMRMLILLALMIVCVGIARARRASCSSI